MERRKEDLTGTLPAEGGQASARDRSPESPPRRKAGRSLGRPLKYAASSVVGCGVDLLLFTLLSLRWSVMLSTVAARCVSGYVNFKLNQVWSFQVRRRTRAQLVKYVLLWVCVMLASGTGVTALKWLPLPLTLIKALVDGALFVMNYFIQRRFVFR